MEKKSLKKTILFVIIFIGCFLVFAIPMGVANSLSTIMNTAYQLLLDTCFYIMALCVMAGALSELLSIFGVIDLFNYLLSPLMKPLYGMPGASALGILTSFCSDNPAILTLANDPEYRKHFKQYQIPALTNVGTAFGMGLVVITYMLGLRTYVEEGIGLAVLSGFLGAVIGSIVSARMMLHFTKKIFGKEENAKIPKELLEKSEKPKEKGKTRKEGQGIFLRVLNAALSGGKRGVDIGLSIIPGVCVICTIVLMLTNGPTSGVYTGGAKEGIALIPFIADKLSFILKPLFGFTSAESISVPITALGSAGAAIALIPNLLENGLANSNDIAVFTSMCMCWSGYLSTHASMMDVLDTRECTGKSILSHTIGGLMGGISAHFIYMLLSLL